MVFEEPATSEVGLQETAVVELCGVAASKMVPEEGGLRLSPE
jgi:hypothetical protein